MKYHISQDGVIYSINEDSTITKYGRVKPNGQVEAADGTPPRRMLPVKTRDTAVRRRPVWGYWVAIVILLLACGVGGFVIWMDNQKTESLQRQVKDLSGQNSTSVGTLRQKDELIESLQTQLAEAGRKRVEAENALNQLTEAASATAPLIVASVDLANYGTANKPLGRYGEPLKQSSLCYLKVKINYYGLRQGIQKINVKLYEPNGRMSGGDREYSFGNDCPIRPGANQQVELGGYGYAEAGRWAPGSYLLELYSSGVCIFRKQFTVIQ